MKKDVMKRELCARYPERKIYLMPSGTMTNKDDPLPNYFAEVCVARDVKGEDGRPLERAGRKLFDVFVERRLNGSWDYRELPIN